MSWHDHAASDPSIGPVRIVGRHVAQTSGYSLLEIARAGLTVDEARRLGIPIEAERASAVGCNVLQLRRIAALE